MVASGNIEMSTKLGLGGVTVYDSSCVDICDPRAFDSRLAVHARLGGEKEKGKCCDMQRAWRSDVP